jgi:hypothetical protein
MLQPCHRQPPARERRGARRLLGLLLLGGLLGGVPLPARAAPRTTQEQLAGQVILSPREFPSSFPSDRAFLQAMRKMKTSVFKPLPKGGWTLHFLAFFRVPLEETSCEIHVFDVTHKSTAGTSRYVETMNQFLPQRGQQTLASTLRLDPDRYEAGHRYRLIVARRTDRALLAEAHFQLAGPG